MNPLKTFLLLAGLTALFGAIGLFIAGPTGMIIALGLGVAMNLFTYWNSDKMVLRMYKAQPIDPSTATGLVRTYYEDVEALARRAQMPMPRVFIIDNDQPNAFATGRNPENAAVAATTGLLRMLDRDEIRGVMAHELAHVKNRDTLIMTVAATLAGAISALANFAFFFGGNQDEEGNGGGNIVAVLLMAVLGPMAAMLVQMAISRTREYSADKLGAEIAGDPESLARALRKIEAYAKGIVNPEAEHNPASAHMFIINPLHGRGMDNLFSTHPATENRVRSLMQLAVQMNAGGGRATAGTSVPTTH